MIEEGGGYYVGGGWRKGKMRIIQIMSIRSDGGRSVGKWPQGDTFAPTTTDERSLERFPRKRNRTNVVVAAEGKEEKEKKMMRV